jgi:hypothetical protein
MCVEDQVPINAAHLPVWCHIGRLANKEEAGVLPRYLRGLAADSYTELGFVAAM